MTTITVNNVTVQTQIVHAGLHRIFSPSGKLYLASKSSISPYTGRLNAGWELVEITNDLAYVIGTFDTLRDTALSVAYTEFHIGHVLTSENEEQNTMNEIVTVSLSIGKSNKGQVYKRIALHYDTHVVTLYDDLDAKLVDTALFNQVEYEFWQQYNNYSADRNMLIDRTGLWARYTIHDIENTIGQNVYALNSTLSGKWFIEGKARVMQQGDLHNSWVVAFYEDNDLEDRTVTRFGENLFSSIGEAELAVIARNQ